MLVGAVLEARGGGQGEQELCPPGELIPPCPWPQSKDLGISGYTGKRKVLPTWHLVKSVNKVRDADVPLDDIFWILY